ncbi:YbaK/EbsC family protein [Streptomyces hilarionis]|uniref:YbaK/EbsC family protein n=1 Tax=Streptomyces hilarionis TaxID=2839954 RepID=UPI002119DC79|nr:YbaK/EbsC family protein [Streptomyces hilarionis]MCQ9131549.1 YbaK/EbsC family protein [Streptomyces hilarionis]
MTPLAAHPRFTEARRTLGHDGPSARSSPEATRSAAEAVAAVGREPSRIRTSPAPADGAFRVDVERVRTGPGAGRVTPAASDVVGETTRYVIGGVPPLGHRTPTRVPADRVLPAHQVVRAAAGGPHVVLPVAPGDLVRRPGATLGDVRERAA